jgi:hypothetical protein
LRRPLISFHRRLQCRVCRLNASGL